MIFIKNTVLGGRVAAYLFNSNLEVSTDGHKERGPSSWPSLAYRAKAFTSEKICCNHHVVYKTGTETFPMFPLKLCHSPVKTLSKIQ